MCVCVCVYRIKIPHVHRTHKHTWALLCDGNHFYAWAIETKCTGQFYSYFTHKEKEKDSRHCYRNSCANFGNCIVKMRKREHSQIFLILSLNFYGKKELKFLFRTTKRSSILLLFSCFIFVYSFCARCKHTAMAYRKFLHVIFNVYACTGILSSWKRTGSIFFFVLLQFLNCFFFLFSLHIRHSFILFTVDFKFTLWLDKIHCARIGIVYAINCWFSTFGIENTVHTKTHGQLIY